MNQNIPSNSLNKLFQRKGFNVKNNNPRLTEVFAALNEIFQASAQLSPQMKNSILLVPINHLDRAKFPLDMRMSAVAVVYDPMVEGGTTASYSMLWITPEGASFEKILTEYDNQTARAVDELIQSYLLSQLNRPEITKMRFTSQLLLPADTDLKQQQDTFAQAPISFGIVSDLFQRAAFECPDTRQEEVYVDLAAAIHESGSSLYVDYKFGKGETTDIMGSPIRDDVILTFSMQPRGWSSRISDTVNRDVEMVRATGYIEFVLANSVVTFPWSEAALRYIPRFVITSVFNEGTSLHPQQNNVIAIQMADAFMRSPDWVGVFEEGLGEGKYNDLSNLADRVHKLPPYNNGPKRPWIVETLSKLLVPGHVVTLEMPYNETAGRGFSLRSERFFAELNDAVCHTIGGNVRHGAPHMSPCYMANVDLGYYTDAQGKRTDIRYIDQMALLCGSYSVDETNKFADSYFPKDSPGFYGPGPMQDREGKELRKNLRARAVHDVTYNGVGVRVDISPDFIMHAGREFVSAGIMVRFKSNQERRPRYLAEAMSNPL
jgi:hypothetical protein